ncbi:MAG: hypothetical protein Fur0040_06210 [Sideroxydans sp.]
MNDTPPLPQAPAPSARPPAGNWLGNLIDRASLTQLTLVVLVVVFVWQWLDTHWRLIDMQQQVAQRLAAVEGENAANQKLAAQNQELVRELGGKLSVLESRFAETQDQRAALETLYREMSSSRDQTTLADVEQLALIADQQLRLSANVKAALIALENADARLQQLDRPTLNPLRQVIRRDIERLRALPVVDLPALNQQLDRLLAAADTLPLRQDTRVPPPMETTPPETSSAWIRFWRELWQELRSLVRIEHTQMEDAPLLSPTQTFFLRENLKLRLLSARLALLSRDDASFQRELQGTSAWITRYFDPQSKASAEALATLQKMATLHISIEVPDIGDSMQAVRRYRTAHERGGR